MILDCFGEFRRGTRTLNAYQHSLFCVIIFKPFCCVALGLTWSIFRQCCPDERGQSRNLGSNLNYSPVPSTYVEKRSWIPQHFHT